MSSRQKRPPLMATNVPELGSLLPSLDTPGCRPACFLTHGCSGAGGVPLCMRMRPHTEADSWGVPRARAGSSAAERGSYSCSSALGTSAWKISWRERQPLKQHGWWTSNPTPPGGAGGRRTEKRQGLLRLPQPCRPRSRDVPPRRACVRATGST